MDGQQGAVKRYVRARGLAAKNDYPRVNVAACRDVGGHGAGAGWDCPLRAIQDFMRENATPESAVNVWISYARAAK